MLRLRQERRRRGWTGRFVAREAGLSFGDLSKLERGLIPAYPGWRRRLSGLFDLPEAVLFEEFPEHDQ